MEWQICGIHTQVSTPEPRADITNQFQHCPQRTALRESSHPQMRTYSAENAMVPAQHTSDLRPP